MTCRRLFVLAAALAVALPLAAVAMLPPDERHEGFIFDDSSPVDIGTMASNRPDDLVARAPEPAPASVRRPVRPRALPGALFHPASLSTLLAGVDRRLEPQSSEGLGELVNAVGRVDDEPMEALEPIGCEVRWVEMSLPRTLPFASAIERAARNADIHPLLLAAIVQAESAFEPNAVSRAGACGLTQLMPAAAADHRVTDVFDPDENLRGGAEHLRWQLDRFSTVDLALAAYNAGPARVRRARGVPPYRETHAFINRVLALFCPGVGGDPQSCHPEERRRSDEGSLSVEEDPSSLRSSG